MDRGSVLLFLGFLTPILHHGLSNDFFCQVTYFFHILFGLLPPFYFPFLFGLLFLTFYFLFLLGLYSHFFQVLSKIKFCIQVLSSKFVQLLFNFRQFFLVFLFIFLFIQSPSDFFSHPFMSYWITITRRSHNKDYLYSKLV